MGIKSPLTDMGLRSLAHAPRPTVVRARKLIREIKKGSGVSVNDWTFRGNMKYSINCESLKDTSTAVSWLKEKGIAVLEDPKILDATAEGDGWIAYLVRPIA